MKKIFWQTICLAALALIFISPAFADEELEKADLARIVHVLNSLSPLINQAQLQQNKNAREQFNYTLLQNDIDKIKSGINQKLHATSIQPRAVTPIQGDYVSLITKHQ